VILIPIAYRYIGPTKEFFISLVIAAVGSLLVGLFSLRKEALQIWAKKATSIFWCLLFPAVLPLSALLMGGVGFQAWQLNTHDLSNYLTTAVETRNHTFDEIQSANPVNPRNTYALALMSDRIAVPVLMGAFQGWAESDFRMSHAGFILAAIVSGAAASATLLQKISSVSSLKTGGKQKFLSVATATAIAGGFFGQIYFDLNAWSAAFAFPLFILSILSFFHLVDSGLISWKKIGFVGLSHTAFLFAYPEQFAVTLALEGALVLFLILKRDLSLNHAFRGIFMPIAAGALFSISLYPNTVGFLIKQILFTSGGAPEGWKVWAQFIFWRIPPEQLNDLASQNLQPTFFSILANLYQALVAVASVLLAEFGLHFINLGYGNIAGITAIMLAATLIFSFSLKVRKTTEMTSMNFLVVMITLLILTLNVLGKNWEGFKAIQWFGPLVAIAIMARAMQIEKWNKANALILILPTFWLGAQGSFAFERINSLYINKSFNELAAYPHDGSLRDTKEFRDIYSQTFFERIPWRECKTSIVILKDQQIQTFIETDILSSGSKLVFRPVEKPQCLLLEKNGELLFESPDKLLKHELEIKFSYPSIVSELDYTNKLNIYLAGHT
jgi:hypothetical protein